MTIQYLDKIARPIQETLPKRYRGHLEVDLAICTNCKACERECPISCIAITDSDEPDKKRWMNGFDIDLAKCMYCGICSEVCPTGAIRHSPEFEGSCYDPAAMVRHFVLDAPVPAFKPKKGEETDIELGIGEKNRQRKGVHGSICTTIKAKEENGRGCREVARDANHPSVMALVSRPQTKRHQSDISSQKESTVPRHDEGRWSMTGAELVVRCLC